MAAKFVINGRPPGSRFQLLDEAATIARYARKVLIESYGDQAPFITQISDLVAGAVDKALRDLQAPLPARAEKLAEEGLRRYPMPARTAEQAKVEPAENDGRAVPGGPVSRREVQQAFSESVESAEWPDTHDYGEKPKDDEWLM